MMAELGAALAGALHLREPGGKSPFGEGILCGRGTHSVADVVFYEQGR